jgi:hypothetical protein
MDPNDLKKLNLTNCQSNFFNFWPHYLLKVFR